LHEPSHCFTDPLSLIVSIDRLMAGRRCRTAATFRIGWDLPLAMLEREQLLGVP